MQVHARQEAVRGGVAGKCLCVSGARALTHVHTQGSTHVSFEAFSRIGTMCGLPEHVRALSSRSFVHTHTHPTHAPPLTDWVLQAILHRLKDFNVSVFDWFEQDAFMRKAFIIFDELDKGSFEAKKAPAPAPDPHAHTHTHSHPPPSARDRDRDRDRDREREPQESAAEKDAGAKDAHAHGQMHPHAAARPDRERDREKDDGCIIS